MKYRDLRGAMKAEGYTIAQIAHRHGVSLTHMNDILAGRTSPRLDLAYEIMDDLKLKRDQIFKYFPPSGEKEGA